MGITILFHVSDKRYDKGYRTDTYTTGDNLCDALRAIARRRGVMLKHGVTVSPHGGKGWCCNFGWPIIQAALQAYDIPGAILVLVTEMPQERREGLKIAMEWLRKVHSYE